MATINDCFTVKVFKKLRQAYFLEVGLTQIQAYHAPSSTACHTKLYVNFSSANFSLNLQAFTS